KDLDRGSWEMIAPGRLKSRRGCHSSPRRLSLPTQHSRYSQTLPSSFNIADSFSSFRPSFPTTCPQLVMAPTRPSPPHGILAPAGPPKWPTFSPPPTPLFRDDGY